VSVTQELKALLGEVQSGVSAIKAAQDEYRTNFNQLQAQADAIEVKLAGRLVYDAANESSLERTVKENESIHRLLRDGRGKAVVLLKGNDVRDLMSRKSIISGVASGSAGGDALNPVGVATSGVLQIDRIPGITPEARQTLKVRDVLFKAPTSMQVIDFVKVSNPLSIASPVPEASVKPENSLSFQSVSERVRVIATWIPATRQVLDDFSELMRFIQSSLPYYVDLAEELQLLAGDNTGDNLHGLLPQAAAFKSALLPPAARGWTKIDVVATAIRQINAAKEIDPTFVIMNTDDWWDIRLTKDNFGRYILGDPQTTVRPNIFGLDVVYTTSIAPGTFLVGSGSPVAAEIRDRMDMTIEISTEHADYFTRNLVAIRAEKRLALITKRPNSFVTGTFTTSP
jgi:HK97 family phage major capsid protein